MAARFTYSRWDGTQTGFEFDVDALFDAMSDDLLYNGNVDQALRSLMNDRVRDMLARIREQRQERLDRGDLGGVFKEISDALDDIVDEERHAIEQAGGDDDRSFRLDMLPDDLAGKVRELQAYDFESGDAQRRFEELIERLRSELMQQAVDQMSSAMQNLSPADMQRMKDMMSSLNDLAERRLAGDTDDEQERFDRFMNEFGDFFPENPSNLDELLAVMAERMAAMQAMLNSMTPEQREQLQQLNDQILEDLDLRWQMEQMSQNLQDLFPQMNWGEKYRMRGDQGMGMGDAMNTMRELGELDRLENLLRNASTPGALAEADLDRVRDLLGDDAARTLERTAEITKMLEAAGLVHQKDGKLELTPKALRKIGNNALRELFAKVAKDSVGQHQISSVGQGHERNYDTKPYEFGDPFNLDLHRTIRNAIVRNGSGTPVSLSPDDFEIERTEHLSRSSTVLMLDLSMSMPMRDNFLPAKKVAVALHALISSRFPRDFLGIVGFSNTAYAISADELPSITWDYMQGTNMHHGFTLARQMLARQSGTKQIIMITDGEPTAHITPDGQPWFNYPPLPETVEVTLKEAARCTRDGIRINTFMLDADRGLRNFVQKLTAINRGRAFFTDHDNLGDFVLLDYMQHKQQQSGGRRVG